MWRGLPPYILFESSASGGVLVDGRTSTVIELNPLCCSILSNLQTQESLAACVSQLQRDANMSLAEATAHVKRVVTEFTRHGWLRVETAEPQT
jgi:hypothetical protein